MRNTSLSLESILLTATLLVAGAAAAPAADGAKVYSAKCKLCHGPTGKPNSLFAKQGVKDLSDPEWQDANSDDQIRKVIVEGVDDTLMRAFRDELKPAEVDAIVTYLRTLRRK